MAGRESYAISNYWKYPRYAKHRRNRTYPSFHSYSKREQTILRIQSVIYFIIHQFIRGDKWGRKMFILDNITIPYNKIIGCKLRGSHDWFYVDEDSYAFCKKCHKSTKTITQDQWNRMKKLKQIKKRTKN